MKVAVFSMHHFEEEFFQSENENYKQELVFFDVALNDQTASLAFGFDCVSCFVTDRLDKSTLVTLKEGGVRLIALRSAGYNNVDLETAQNLEIPVVRVPAYSPYAVAEHAVALLLSLNRKIHRAYSRVRELNFSLEGLIGFDLYGKTVGVIGTGRIGAVFARIMHGFGCRVLAYDPYENEQLLKEKIVTYVPLKELFKNSDIISLHTPLVPETEHLINASVFAQMKKGAFIINTGRGALIDTPALISVLKSGHLGGAALDVYEEEEGIFFKDLSDKVLQDDVLARLLSFPNVLMTSHQAFFTREAVENIVSTTLQNISNFEKSHLLPNEVRASTHIVSKV